MTNIKKDY